MVAVLDIQPHTALDQQQHDVCVTGERGMVERCGLQSRRIVGIRMLACAQPPFDPRGVTILRRQGQRAVSLLSVCSRKRVARHVEATGCGGYRHEPFSVGCAPQVQPAHARAPLR